MSSAFTGPRRPLAALLALAGVVACTPKVEVVAPKDPITINLNINNNTTF